MIARLLFVSSALMVSGCVEISKYSYRSVTDGYVFGLCRDFKGISWGMCGPMTGASLERELWVREKKARYEGPEVMSRHDGKFDSEQFTAGYILVDWDRSEVDIHLQLQY